MAEETQHPSGPGPIKRNVKDVSHQPLPNFQEAQQRSDATGEEMRRAAAGGMAPGNGASASMMPNAVGERPFVEVKLPDGRTVLLEQPEVALAFIIGRILGPQDSQNAMAVGYAKTLMYVAAIDGQRFRRPSDAPSLQALANTIGDHALDLLTQEWAKRWGMPVELEVLKKNLPGQ